VERAKRDLIANKTGRAAAAKSDGARRQSDRKTGLVKWSACGRESKGAPILGKLFLKKFQKKLDKMRKKKVEYNHRKEGAQSDTHLRT
jgi:hypothetical protein